MIQGQGQRRRSRRDPIVRRDDELLSQPRKPGGLSSLYDAEAFGRFAEAIARTLGTGRFLVIQTVVVVAWICLNAVAWQLQWDKYPFILLNLAFSTQAAYAAPLKIGRASCRERVLWYV